MKKSIMLIAVVLLSGCIRAPNYPGMVQIQTNEVAFLVNMTDDNSVVGANVEIQKKDIPIDGYFVRTGRFQHQGYWRPILKVIAVSQAPVRREWDKTDSTQSVRMVSDKGNGFVVPMIINAYIDGQNSAKKYLAAFRPLSDDNIDWSKISQRDWAPYVKENAQPLERALDTVVYTKIVEQLNGLFIKIPILYAEVTSKIFIPAVYEGMSARDLTEQVKGVLPRDVIVTFDRDVPSLKTWAFENYGITITAMAPGDGVLYDSDDIQAQIDKLAIESMRERTLAQEEANARAEQRVRITQADTERQEANLKASAMVTLQRQAEIDVILMVGKAQAEAIAKGNYPPVPTTLITDTRLGAFGFPGLNNLTGR